MALELIGLVIGIGIGVAVGVAIMYAVLQTRVTKNAQQIALSLFEQQKEQLERIVKQQYDSEFEKWKAEYEVTVIERIDAERQDALARSRIVLKGKIGEQMAPLLPEFVSKYEPSDSRFIGTPIDYIIFKNMSKISEGSEDPVEIVFMDVKTGNSNLNKVQKEIKDAVESQRVKFETLRPQVD